MDRYSSETATILTFLAENPGSSSIQEIARHLEMGRIATAKYLDILQAQGRVEARMIGTSKVYSPSYRVPATRFLHLFPFLALILDQNGKIIDISENLSATIHKDKEEMVGVSFDLIPFIPHNEQITSALSQALSGKVQKISIDQIPTQRLHYTRIDVIPAVLENGKPGVLLLFIERDPASDDLHALLDKDYLYRGIEDDEMQYIVRFLPDGVITAVNEAYCRDSGKERETLTGSRFRPLYSGEENEEFVTRIRALSVNNPAVTGECRAVMASGELKWQRWKIKAIFEHGNLIEYQAVGIDITESRHAQENYKRSYERLEELVETRTHELREINKQLYREIDEREKAERQLQLTQFAVDNAADLILWFDREGKIVGANKKITETIGFTAASAHALSWKEITPKESALSWSMIWENVLSSQHYHIALSLMREDGSLVPVDCICNYIKYGKGEFCCCFIRDITERMRVEDAVRNANRKLLFLNHLTRVDIKNALFTLLGYLEILHMPVETSTQMEFIKKIERATDIIRSRIEFATLYQELGSAPPVWQDVGKAFLYARSQIRTEQVTYHNRVQGLVIYADSLLERVLAIILKELTIYSSHLTEVTLSYHLVDQGTEIAIVGDSPGIPLERKEHIFLMDGADTENPGLFLCREVLSLTGISMHEEGDPAMNIRFILTVPDESFRVTTP